ncbi:LuxR C-terminal-related transcriptional regulator [Tautonia sociabilis]|uniref:LuxR C-terminal-related transcriptional regulator n=1 Tax=Tautonia sociabilis TaxID=2080755 RepID=UPI001F3A6A48|nr:LuxR C-terminal-related transcriptional regulator [Tautonia sociabilis]
MSDEDLKKPRRSYRPGVEGLEAMRLFSGLVTAPLAIPAEHGVLPDPVLDAEATHAIGSPIDSAAWDAALDQALRSEFFPLPESESGSSAALAEAPADAEAIRGGLSQLDRYLSRSWARAGLPPQKFDDCTQAVYLTLLKQLGRPGFDGLMAAVGILGIREVFSRDREEGATFFRAIDATKKRAQRERTLRSLDDGLDAPPSESRDRDACEDLDEAIDLALTPREAELIRATLAGETPAEIADRWGVAPKTVSNEKTRAFQKLRSFLSSSDSLSELAS